jgi:cell wall-associated NlpC family hydrolase
MSEAIARQAVLAEAKSWLRTPFHFEARVKSAGVACGPLLIAVYGAAGISVPGRIGHFPADWHLHTTEERYFEVVRQYARPIKTPQPGDIVLFRVFRNRPICHGGIVIDWPLIIHAADRGAVEYLDVSHTALAKREAIFLSPWA